MKRNLIVFSLFVLAVLLGTGTLPVRAQGGPPSPERQAAIAKQQKLLDDPDLYAKDRKKFDEASAAIATAQQELAAAEDRWLELEVLREEIEQA